jgi:hypothetical protein
LEHNIVSKACIRLLACGLLSLLSSIGLHASVVRPLADEWLVYHPYSKNYLPYDYQSDRGVTAVSTWLNPNKDDYYLELTLPLGSSIFFNNHLWYYTKTKGTVHLLLAEVFKAESVKGSPVFLTVFNPKAGLQIDKIGIVNQPQDVLSVTNKNIKTLPPNPIVPISSKQPLANSGAFLFLTILKFKPSPK